MPSTKPNLIEVDADAADFIGNELAAGHYASAGEVVGTAIRLLRARDEAIEDWLHGEVLPVYDTMKTDRARAVPASDAFGAVRARHLARTSKHS